MSFYIEFTIKEDIISKRAQNSMAVEQYEKDLNSEEIANRSVRNTVTLLKQKLEEKKLQIEMVKNPAAFKLESPKNFLASEKLASSKKQRSASPVKGPQEFVLKKVKMRRVKSVTRRTRK